MSLTPSGLDTEHVGTHRRVVLVVFDGFQLLDLAGPADVFATADLLGTSVLTPVRR